MLVMKKNLNPKFLRPALSPDRAGLEKMISDEILKIGDKLPSVRMFSDEYGVSMGTAFQAYYHLESKGLIEARPKSGYYVRFNMRRMPGLPQIVDPEPVASEVSVQEMIATVYRNISSDDLVNFSISAPPLSLLPAAEAEEVDAPRLAQLASPGRAVRRYPGQP